MKIKNPLLSWVGVACAPVVFLLMPGCRTPPPPPVPSPVAYVPPVPKYRAEDDPQPHYTILIESSPPGATIEFNGANMGTTPCRIRIPGEKGRKFVYGPMFEHSFMAIPGPAGGNTQRKTFLEGESIPEKLFFNMALVWR